MGFAFAQPILRPATKGDLLMTRGTEEILRRVAHWPQGDQGELADVAREIEARRTGVYVLSDDEEVALDEALGSGIASDEEVAAFWQRHCLG